MGTWLKLLGRSGHREVPGSSRPVLWVSANLPPPPALLRNQPSPVTPPGPWAQRGR